MRTRVRLLFATLFGAAMSFGTFPHTHLRTPNDTASVFPSSDDTFFDLSRFRLVVGELLETLKTSKRRRHIDEPITHVFRTRCNACVWPPKPTVTRLSLSLLLLRLIFINVCARVYTLYVYTYIQSGTCETCLRHVGNIFLEFVVPSELPRPV